jgi:hypothetical protein
MDDIEETLSFDDPELVKLLFAMVDRRVDKKINELNFDKTYSATIITVHTGNADIQLQGSVSTILAVPNKTGVTLVNGDQVYVEAINGSLNNLVIKYKK